MDWRSNFDERELREIDFCRLYHKQFMHGTLGHNIRVIVAKMEAFDAEKWWNGEKLAIAIAEREQDAAYDEGVVMRPGEAKEMFVEG